MRIVLAPNSYPPDIGGLEIAVSSMARELALRGHAVAVVTTAPWHPMSAYECPPGVRVYRLPFALPRLVFRAGARRFARSLLSSALSPFVAPFSLSALVRIIRRESPELVNLHYVAENAFYVLAAQRLVPFRLVVNLHGNDVEWHGQRSAIAQQLTRWTLRRADYVLANSAHILGQADHILSGRLTKCGVVGNGVDVDRFAAGRGLRRSRPYILSLGNFGYKKGFDQLVRGFAAVHRRHPEVDLIMAGDGHERRRCQNLAHDLGLGQAVTFLGRVDHSDVPALMRGCQVFVLPSRQEPFGIVLLEAMAAKRPIVATRVGGVPEIITHAHHGLLVDPESPSGLADAISLLLTTPSLREKVASQAYDRVKEHFNWPAVCDRLERVYQEVVHGTPA